MSHRPKQKAAPMRPKMPVQLTPRQLPPSQPPMRPKMDFSHMAGALAGLGAAAGPKVPHFSPQPQGGLEHMPTMGPDLGGAVGGFRPPQRPQMPGILPAPGSLPPKESFQPNPIGTPDRMAAFQQAVGGNFGASAPTPTPRPMPSILQQNMQGMAGQALGGMAPGMLNPLVNYLSL